MAACDLRTPHVHTTQQESHAPTVASVFDRRRADGRRRTEAVGGGGGRRLVRVTNGTRSSCVSAQKRRLPARDYADVMHTPAVTVALKLGSGTKQAGTPSHTTPTHHTLAAHGGLFAVKRKGAVVRGRKYDVGLNHRHEQRSSEGGAAP